MGTSTIKFIQEFFNTDSFMTAHPTYIDFNRRLRAPRIRPSLIFSPGILSFLFLLSFLFPSKVLLAEDSLHRAGWIEEVLISSKTLRLNAKLDTGAKTSSIHAENVSSFSRDGARWVKFNVLNSEGKPIAFERKVQRTVKIKRHKQKSAERPVVLLGICLGNYYEEAEVNLSNRSNYKYPVLIGRTFLAGHFMVDPSSKHLLRPSCHVESAAQ